MPRRQQCTTEQLPDYAAEPPTLLIALALLGLGQRAEELLDVYAPPPSDAGAEPAAAEPEPERDSATSQVLFALLGAVAWIEAVPRCLQQHLPDDAPAPAQAAASQRVTSLLR